MFPNVLFFFLVKIAVFLYVTPYSLVGIYQLFGGTCVLHLQSRTGQKIELASSFKTLVTDLFGIVHFVHFLDQCTQFITSTKCTVLYICVCVWILKTYLQHVLVPIYHLQGVQTEPITGCSTL